MGILDVIRGKTSKEKEKEKAAERSTALRAEAMANARAARERLGDETIQKIADALQRQSAGAKARELIRELDPAHVADHVKIILDDDKNKG